MIVTIALNSVSYTQNVFNPDDPIIRHDASKPYGSQQNPDTTRPGLQKWVSRPASGVSYGNDAYDASSFKQYFINTGSGKMAFRIKFPRSYSNPDSAGKKYPVNLFLHGGGEVGCPANGGIYNNERPIWLGGKLFMQMVDNNKFDGFLLYPQLVIYNGCFAGWLAAPPSAFQSIISMIDSLGKYARLDIDRVLVTGLSGGGYGAWRMAEWYPQRIAKIMPSAASGVNSNRAAFVHIPIWFATGGKDPEPSPAQAAAALLAMQNLGADIRYTQFPEKGHAMWYNHWAEPDFIPAMNDMHKANPLVFFQRTGYCREEDVNAKLGITQGFYAYEWQRNGITIAIRNGNDDLVTDPLSVISFSGNDITVRAYGTYRVRFKRTASSEFSAWSPKPAVITTKTTTQTLPIQVKGARSKVLPALDGSTTVPLTLADGFSKYEWFTAATEQLLDSQQVYEASVGDYKGRYEETFGCGTTFSPVFTVVDANGSPKPSPAQQLSASPLSPTVVRLSWTDGSNETGFEVYRSTTPGGPYQFVALTGPNATSYRDSFLTKNAMYHYVVRAVSETGAAVASNETVVRTLIDNQPPTAPSGLKYTAGSTPTTVTLNWTASTDNTGIERYDIFVNGELLYSTTGTTYVVSGLDSLAPYNFVVKAVDKEGNKSPASNQVTYLPPGTPPGVIPGTPDSVVATVQTYNKIKITWKDTSANETAFEIVRSLLSDGPYVPVGSVAKDITSFTDSALASSTTFYYKVRAVGNYGESAFSDSATATTPARPDTPLPPSQLVGTTGETAAIAISWIDNSDNETNFLVYRSTDDQNYTLIGTLPANTNAFTDTSAENLTYYYYYVAGKNAAGEGEASNKIHIKAGNKAPVISLLDDIFVKSAATVTDDFNVADDAGETVQVDIEAAPSFITLQSMGSTEYRLTARPPAEAAGTYEVTVKATDNGGLSASKKINVYIGDKNTKSVFVNFGSAGKTAPAPWNNWLGTLQAGASLTGLTDENNAASSITLTMLSPWSFTTNMGHLTGDDSGVFPDAVLASGLVDSLGTQQIKIAGLDPARQYNIVLAGSQNEGITAVSRYSSAGDTASLNARYNTNQTANLNNLVPSSSGELTVSINRAAGSRVGYLNGLAIEEIDASVQLLGPDNLYVEPVDRNSVKLTWSDRTKNESAADGYELVRAGDSLFAKNLKTVSLPGNSTSFTDTALTPNTKYWYRVRAKNGTVLSDYSRRTKIVTAESIVYVNFNVTVEDAPAPWNNLEAAPMFAFTTANLKNQSGSTSNLSLTLTKEFNGEFTAGVSTGNNSGVVPDNTLRANYWLDRQQQSQFRVNGLNHSKRYRVGFIGSSSPPVWFKGNYTATYSINGKTVYLNSWENSTKIVRIGDVVPDPDGTLKLDFSTVAEAGYGFNSGLIIEEYNDIDLYNPIDTVPTTPPDTTDPNPPNPPDTTDPGGPVNPPDTTDPANPYGKITVFPNPFRNRVRMNFYNRQATDHIDIAIHDPEGRILFRRSYGTHPVGSTNLEITGFESGMRTGVYIATLIVNGEVVQSFKLVKSGY